MQTIGERLEDARKKRGISIREAAEATKVRGDYLQRFENNQFDIGLTDIYVRGFLRGYAAFLKLPADRILSDYAALGHGEVRPRQPSREVYGRMEVSIVSGEERGGEAAAGAPAAGETAPQQPRVPRTPRNVPAGPILDQALIYKGGIALACLVALILIVWVVKSLYGSAGSPTRQAPATPISVSAAADPTVTIFALAPVKIKVARQSDRAELFQGQIEANERKDFPNVPLFLTATALESVRIEYKGKVYQIQKQGYDRVPLDFSGTK